MNARPAYIAALGVSFMTWGGGWMLFGLAVLIFMLPSTLVLITLAYFPVALIRKRKGGPGRSPGRPGGRR